MYALFSYHTLIDKLTLLIAGFEASVWKVWRCWRYLSTNWKRNWKISRICFREILRPKRRGGIITGSNTGNLLRLYAYFWSSSRKKVNRILYLYVARELRDRFGICCVNIWVSLRNDTVSTHQLKFTGLWLVSDTALWPPWPVIGQLWPMPI